ncbi:hypothetical protein [Deinococcus peraridilitoris]|uniref:Uncharacterized protein n=1 Tax=Deinococcus peraridilitoris (strain DSM 19664 / LMG 22246 / CIP 109416 / KR-200) TaxID=937777 RepID=L0A5S4_DEIPD|nr:hypothetical protein [Deinococcus peraridilitoris]AFZ68794.1 hypothetical protein Deipe_3354 [Deinococcus peraridilitoris DSM 19664]
MTLTARQGREAGSLRAWLVGLSSLVLLTVLLFSTLDWPVKLGAWVLLTLILDECGGWFGYTGAVAGALPLVAPLLAPLLEGRLNLTAAPPEWSVVFPLVCSGLVALLLVKHAGGLLALPLALGAFVLPILLARMLAPQLDTSLTLPASRTFFSWALWPAVIGVSLAAVRHFVLPQRRMA